MPPTPYSAKAYQATAVDTSDRNHQVVLLFEASVRFLNQARLHMEAGNHHGQCEAVVRVQRILSALMTSLDHDAAPDLTSNLSGLYTWLHNCLTEASIGDDLPLLDEVRETMAALCEAWRQAEAALRAGQTDPSVPQAA